MSRISATRPRRSFMAALSAFVAAPAAVSAPALAAKVESGESPELLALGERLHPALTSYREAAAAKVAARAHFERLKPMLPDELIVPEGADNFSELSAVEFDPFLSREAEPHRRIYDWRRVSIYIISRDVAGTTRRGRQLRRVARLARRYEAAMEAAIWTSGYYDAEEEARCAAEAVCDLAVPLLQHTPVGMAGFAILAKAMLAVEEVKGDLFEGKPTHFSALGVHLARAVTGLRGGQANG